MIPLIVIVILLINLSLRTFKVIPFSYSFSPYLLTIYIARRRQQNREKAAAAAAAAAVAAA